VTKGTHPWDQKVLQGKQDRESSDKRHTSMGPDSAPRKARQVIKWRKAHIHGTRKCCRESKTVNQVTKGTHPWDQKVLQGKQDRESSDKRHTSMGPESAAGKARQGIK